MGLWQLLSVCSRPPGSEDTSKLFSSTSFALYKTENYQCEKTLNEKLTTVHWVAVQAVARNIQEVIKLQQQPAAVL